MSTLKIAQQKICVEKVKESDSLELFEMRKHPVKSQTFQKLKAAFLTKKLWPQKSVIKIAFLDKGSNVPRTPLSVVAGTRDEKGNPLLIDPLQLSLTPKDNSKPLETIEAVKKIVAERVQPIVGLKLEFTDNIAESTIRITFNPSGGAWSLLGTDIISPQFKGQPTMNLGWLDVATTIHEFGHALGMIHEHQNPDGNLIDWNVPKVLEWAQVTQGWDETTTRHNIIDRYDIDEINGSKYDPNSIMLYFFPGTLTLNNKGTHQNLRLSSDDVLYLNKMYPNSKVDPSSFYESSYGININDTVNKSNTLLILFSIVIIGALLWFGYKKWKERQLIQETLELSQNFM